MRYWEDIFTFLSYLHPIADSNTGTLAFNQLIEDLDYLEWRDAIRPENLSIHHTWVLEAGADWYTEAEGIYFRAELRRVTVRDEPILALIEVSNIRFWD